MKLLQLRLKNLNSIREEVAIDLENGPLSETSLFAITGPTGSGKTTLLDAISVALYHKTPRLDGTATKSPENLLSQGCQEGFAEVQFEVNGNRYLAEWQVKRKRGDKLDSAVKLIEVATGTLLNDKKSQNPVPRLIGLDFDAFRRSVLLAQGEFAAFLKANQDTKRKLLENITGIGWYDELREVLNDRHKSAKSEFEKIAALVENVPSGDPKIIEELAAKLTDLQAQKVKFEQAKQVVDQELILEQRRQDDWQKLTRKKADRQQLLARQSEIDQQQQALIQAEKAVELRPNLEAHQAVQKRYAETVQLQHQLEQDLPSVRSTFADARQEFETAREAYETRKNSSIAEFARLTQAAEFEIKAQNLADEIGKKQLEADNYRRELEKIEQELMLKAREKSAIVRNLETSQAQFQKIRLADDAAPRIAQLNQDLATLRANHQKLKELEADGKKFADELKRRAGRKSELEPQIAALSTQRSQFDARLKHLETAIEKLLLVGDEKYWEQRRHQAITLQSVAVSFEQENRRCQELANQQRQFNEAQAQSAAAIEQNQQRLTQARLELKLNEEKINRVELEIKNCGLIHAVSVLRRQQLQPAQPCPVCGAAEHPWAERQDDLVDIPVDRLEAELAAAKENRHQLQEKLQKLDAAHASLTATRTQQTQRTTELDAQLRELQEKLDQYQQRWIQVYSQQPIAIDWIQRILAECEHGTKNLRELQIQRELLNLEFMQTDVQLATVLKEHSLVAEQIQAQTPTLDTRRKVYSQLKENNQILRNSFLNRLPAELQVLAPEEGLAQFQKRLEAAQKLEKDLARLNQNLVEVQTFLTENQKRQLEIQQRLNSLMNEILQYQTENNTFLQQATQITGGRPATQARQELEAQLTQLEQQKNHAQEIYQNARARQTEIETRFHEQTNRLGQLDLEQQQIEKKYLAAVIKAGFPTITEHQQALRPTEWIHETRQTIQDYQQQRYSLEQEVKTLEENFQKLLFDPKSLASLQDQSRRLEAQVQESINQMGSLQAQLDMLQKNIENYQGLVKKLAAAQGEFQRWDKLNSLIGANKLRDFALKSMFDLLIRFANQQMQKLTGRYFLKVKDMKEMVVVDTWNAGEERPVETLSGGESFLTSLALALALSELSKGRARLGALFLDEGFGALDLDTLDIALDALESLRLTGRTVGIISHVQELTRRIPVRIVVKKKGDGSSSVAVEGGI
ncbi:AAA family ATPase [candidate division KSB1 bacterium]|nr:AAA family ATPase [candidate division KSB1 bacterium]